MITSSGAPDVSIVIATRDRAGFLHRALSSLVNQRDGGKFEVVVADNGSRDATAAVADRWSSAEEFDVRRVFVPEPNRAKARNAALALVRAPLVLFVDDDVSLPERFVAAHVAAHRNAMASAVSGPIINVASYDLRPEPAAANYSRAFLCTCNVSVPRAELAAVGGFDERFDLYGWEDTELGLRLRRRGVRRAFAWDAYLWHIKPPHTETLERVLTKSIERARMAAELLARDDEWRIRLATGGYRANLWRARLLAPGALHPWLAGIARSERFPSAVRSAARAALLDGVYTNELRRALDARR